MAVQWQLERSPFSLRGRVALITGGSRSLGKEMVLALARAGADVIVVSRNYEACLQVAEEASACGIRSLAIAADVTSETDIQNTATQVEKQFGQLDILVNNAAVSPFMAPVLETRLSGWEKVLKTNLTGPFLCSRILGQLLVNRRYGRIINIASVAGLTVVKGLGAYSVSKAGLIHLTHVLAAELGAYNVTVNAIAPGFMDRGLADVIVDAEGFQSQVMPRTPLARGGRAEELTGALLYLASEASSYVTGQTISVDGGMSAV